MNHDVKLNLIHRYLADECTPEERKRVNKWIEADSANRKSIETLQKIWNVQPRKEVKSDIQLAWKHLEEQLEEQEQVLPFGEKEPKERNSYSSIISKKSHATGDQIWLRVAAVVMMAFLLSLLFLDFRSSEPAKQTEMVMREVVTKRAHQAQLTFSDGTRVTLNAASRIRFPERFDYSEREVYLEGEAYFEVAPKSGVAFVVNTRDARVKVLGTKFNVKARPEDREVQVAVAQGKVSVHSEVADTSMNSSEVVLTKGQMSTVKPGFAPTSPRVVNINNYLTWIRGDFVFEEAPFSDVLREWERRFDVSFTVRDSSLLSVLFTGEFRNEKLEEMLKLASQSLEFNYHRNGDTIIIRKE